MSKRPSFQFYPADWIRDEVSGCSLAAQGLWLRLMIIMHDSPQYGMLVMPDGSPMPDQVACRRCGCSLREYRQLLDELSKAGISRKNEKMIVFSKRMLEDEKERLRWRKSKRNQQKRPFSPRHFPEVSGKIPGLSSSSSSSSSSKQEKETPTPTPAPAVPLPDWMPPEDWRDYLQMRVRIRKPLTPAGYKTAFGKLMALQARGHPPAAVLQQSVFHSWQGLFEIHGDDNGRTGQARFKPSGAVPAQHGKYAGLKPLATG